MINVILGVWQFLLVWMVGFAIERKCRFSLPYGYRVSIAFGLGEISISYSLFLLGLVGGLRFWILIPLAVFATVCFLSHFLTHVKTMLKRSFLPLRAHPLAAGISLVILIFYALGTCVPEREVDSLWYHLATPLFYIQNGGFIQEVPFNMPSHYPMNVHLHYTFSLLVGNDTTAKVFIFLHFIPFIIMLYAVVKRYGAEKWGVFAIAVFLCCLHFRVPVMVNVQRAVYFHVFVAVVLLWQALESRYILFYLISALFCGMAMGTKFNGILFGLVPLCLMQVLFIVREGKLDLHNKLKFLGLYITIAMVMYSPWAVKSWLITGNPLYPMMGNVFHTKEHYVPAMLSNAKNHGLNIMKSENVSQFIGEVVGNVAKLLYEADLIFFLGLIAILVLGMAREKRWKYPYWSGVIAYALFPMLWGSDIGRLFAVSYSVLIVLVAFTMNWLSQYVSFGRLLSQFILISLFITFFQQRYLYLRSPNIQWFGGVYLSEPARQQWLTERNIFSKSMFRMKDWMDENIPKNERLYGYDSGYLFYLRRNYIVCGAHFGKKIRKMDEWLQEGPIHTAQKLRKYNIKWILWNQDDFHTRSMEQQQVWMYFVNHYLEPVHREDSVSLYRFNPPDKLPNGE